MPITKTVRKKISAYQSLRKQIIQCSPVIDGHKDVIVKMASYTDITDMVKYHKTKKPFEPQYFVGKATDNAIFIYLHSITIVNLIK